MDGTHIVWVTVGLSNMHHYHWAPGCMKKFPAIKNGVPTTIAAAKAVGLSGCQWCGPNSGRDLRALGRDKEE